MARGVKRFTKSEDRDRAFVFQYLRLQFKAKEAAIAIGLPARSASSEASKLLNSPNVQMLLVKEREKIADRCRVSINNVVDEIRKIAFSNFGDYVSIGDDGIPFVDLSKCSKEQLAAIAEASVVEETFGEDEGEKTVKRVKLKTHPKLDALVKLLQYLGGFDGKGKVDGDGNNVFNLTQVNVHVGGTRKDAESRYLKSLKNVTDLVEVE